MASDHNGLQISEERSSNSSNSLNSDLDDQISEMPRSEAGWDTGIKVDPLNHFSRFKLLNEAHLVRNRCINFNHRTRRQFELMCEDKVSKHKLEEVHCSLPSSVKSTFIMTFSPDGRKVASTHGDHRIYICDLNTGKLLDTLDGHPKTPWCLAWHPSNKEILASGCLAGEVRVWDLRSRACELWTSDNNTIISSLDFHPKERVLVIATANDILFWDWSQSRPFAKTTTTHEKEKVKFVEFDSSGTRLITGISNLPRFSGYSSDSLQNRIIDSYLTHGALEPENMTQNSDTNTPLNSNDTSNDRLPGGQAHVSNRPTMQLYANNNEQDFNQRSTLTLSRVAYLYRQLEALEDSMRHTTFAPYPNSRPPFGTNNQASNQEEHLSRGSNVNRPMSSEDNSPDQTGSPTNVAASQSVEHESHSSDTSGLPSSRSSNSFEPFVVSFDESLENLQLSPLVIDGQAINLATVIEQYPIEFPHQVHFMMHYESINQVNQNFIRISKLMSSIRLYRQVVQQITSNSSGTNHFQPNQILTAQSTSLRSTRPEGSLPVIFRNLPIGASPLDINGPLRTRQDPVMAIQFRNSARNVPLVTICKIDLLSARSVCIMRSQQLIEQAINVLRPSITTYTISPPEMFGASRSNPDPQLSEAVEAERHNDGSNLQFCQLLSQLHQSLTTINHAPLTTSNVHAHITSLRNLINKVVNALTSLIPSREEGRRLTGLIHDIAHSLTGRSWSIPLGATLDDIRLDVIHTLCIVDLTLHLTRQIQLLQMHRLSAMSRIEEYRRASNPNRDFSPIAPRIDAEASVPSTSYMSDSHENLIVPSTSREGLGFDRSQTKRKSQDKLVQPDEIAKRRKFESESGSNHDIEMIDARQETSNTETSASPSTVGQTSTNNLNSTTTVQPSLPTALADSLPVERLIVWNSSQGQADEQSLQRFLVATAASMNSNSQILVRIYHRANGGNSSNILDNPVERPVLPIESRRRALSQDNSAVSQDSLSPPVVEAGRPRQPVTNHGPSAGGSPGGVAYETWHRTPHFHVIQARGPGQHLWFNQWTISLPLNSNYRLQCWNFSLDTIPNIKDSQSNIVTQKCRIMNDSSIDISSDGSLVACLVPRDDGSCLPNFDLKVFSLRSHDFGTCYHQLPHGSNAVSVCLSPTANYAVVGLASNKFISNDSNEDDLTIAKVFKLDGKNSHGCVRDIKIKRDDSSLSLNAIRWMPRGIVYNVGPQHHQRYQTARMRNRFV